MATRRAPVRKGAPKGDNTPTARTDTPLLEWVAAGVGGCLLVAVVVILALETLAGRGAPPDLVVRVQSATKVEAGYRLEIEVDNKGDQPAGQVEVEAQLTSGSAQETASLTLDYVPGRSTRAGGLFFEHDPRQGEMTLRATAYSAP
jgi:uncharacterized protein (TIGR02588 family)